MMDFVDNLAQRHPFKTVWVASWLVTVILIVFAPVFF